MEHHLLESYHKTHLHLVENFKWANATNHYWSDLSYSRALL